MREQQLQEMRAIITTHKRWDMMFGVLGIIALMIGLLTFVALFTNMAINGLGRIDMNFLTSFPSRRAADAGILSAWVGSILVMFVTACAAVQSNRIFSLPVAVVALRLSPNSERRVRQAKNPLHYA